MTTKTYSDLLSIIKSLCGVEFATIELPRINTFVNRRAKRAYRASNNWPRFITVGEARTTAGTTSKYVPYTQAAGGLGVIGTFLKINAVAPFTTSSPQDINFHVDSNGANLITSNLPTSVFVTYKKVLADTYGDTTGMVQEIPSEWFDYIAHGVYSDYLRAEGQQEKSQLTDQEASVILDDELIQVDQQGAGMTFGARYLQNTAGNNTSNNMLRRSLG